MIRIFLKSAPVFIDAAGASRRPMKLPRVIEMPYLPAKRRNSRLFILSLFESIAGNKKYGD
jgi:hypothetical protein